MNDSQIDKKKKKEKTKTMKIVGKKLFTDGYKIDYKRYSIYYRQELTNFATGTCKTNYTKMFHINYKIKIVLSHTKPK